MNHYFGHHTLEGEWHALLPRYIMLAERIAGARVLDIGCGSGLGSSLLLELGAEAVDAIDHRPGVLEIARMKHTKQNLDFHVMLWEELDFPENTFDVIVCLDPASPVTDPNLLREVHRVLKPGGQYICAIERSTVQGMETLLPRYGYTEMAERIEFNETVPSKVPQVGELSRHFENVYTLHQRPLYSFLFDRELAHERASSLPELDEESSEVSEASEAEETGKATSPKSVSPSPVVNTSFYDTSPEPAAVELWFCGESSLEEPHTMEVRLPYYRLIERLQHQVQTLQARQREQSEQSFDELLEEGTEAFEDSTRTLEIAHPFEKEITQVKPRPLLPAQSAIQNDQLDAHIQSLQALHRRMQTDFERILFDTQAALDVRHEHMDTLIDTSTRQINQQIGHQQLHQHIANLEAQLRQVTDERNHLLAERETALAAQQGLEEAISQASSEACVATETHEETSVPRDEAHAQDE